ESREVQGEGEQSFARARVADQGALAHAAEDGSAELGRLARELGEATDAELELWQSQDPSNEPLHVGREGTRGEAWRFGGPVRHPPSLACPLAAGALCSPRGGACASAAR